MIGQPKGFLHQQPRARVDIDLVPYTRVDVARFTLD
jgi:hypothetical protein